jgi:formyltetrahydrofolate deformylase
MTSPDALPVTATLLVACSDRTGLVAALSDFVFTNGGNILDADQHAEVETGLFFMRLRWDLRGFKLDRVGIGSAMKALAERFDLSWELTYSDIRPRVAVFASKAPHCLYDLLLSHQLGELGGELVVVVSNHEVLRSVAGHFGVRFEHIPVHAENKATAEAAEQELLAELRIDLVVLARYMQILSGELLDALAVPVINIHHSFLPAFAGAKPYAQAKQRGVQLSGATAHYVTEQLDEGPIIEQDTVRVTHRDDVPALMRLGADIERTVLARAVRWHCEDRVLRAGETTVVF